MADRHRTQIRKTLAEVSLGSAPSVGSASGNNVGVTGRINFIAAITAGVLIDYTADLYVRALLSADLIGVDSNASTSFSINIINVTTGGQTVLNYAPSALNTGRSATVPGDDFEQSLVGYVDGDTAARTFQIVQGNQYQLTIDQASDANSQIIPAPAPLLLIGIGVLGLGAARRARRG